MRLSSILAALLAIGTTVPAFADYRGPIDLALEVQAYDAATATFVPFANGHIFVNTIMTSPQGGRSNQYLRTDAEGRVHLTVSRLTAGAHLTVYGVRSTDSSIRLDCKLRNVPEDAKPYILVPDASEAGDITRTVQLAGSCLQLN